MRYLTRPIVFLLMLILVAACAQATPEPPTLVPFPPTATETPPPTPIPGPTATPGIVPRTIALNPAEQAYLRVVHAAPGTPIVDVYIELLSVAVNLDFGLYTDRAGITAGEYNLRVVPTGQSVNSEALLQMPLAIRGGQSLVLLITGTTDALTVTTYNESANPLGRNEARLNVIHAVPRGPDFVLQKDAVNLTPNLSFGQASPELVFVGGENELVFQSGTTSLFTYSANLRERTNYTLILVGNADDLANLSVITFESEAPGLTRIETINASSYPSVDFYLGNLPLATGVGFGVMTDQQSVASNIYDLNVYETGVDRNTVQPILTTQILANPDEIVKYILVGEPGALQLVIYYQNDEPTEPDNARVAFLNTLPITPRVRLDVNGFETYDFFFGEVSDEIDIQAGEAILTWFKVDGSEATDILENPPPVQLSTGQTYLYLFAGRQFDTPLLFNGLNVGIQEGVLEDVEPNITPGATPTRLRFVNAMPTLAVTDILVDDILTVPGLAYGTSSSLIIVQDGVHVVTMQDPTTGQLLARLEILTDLASDYSIFAFGNDQTGFQLISVPDLTLQGRIIRPTVRLINLSVGNGSPLGIGYSPASSDVFQPDASTNFRVSIPIGIKTIIRDTLPNQISNVLPIPEGAWNIAVLDTGTPAGLAFTITNVTFQPDIHYDILVFQDPQSQQVIGLVVAYPAS